MTTSGNRGTKISGRGFLALATMTALALSFALTACQKVSSSDATALVRAVDASTGSVGLNLSVAGTLLATNLGEGTVSAYGSFSPSTAAAITLTASGSTTSTTLASTTATLAAGTHHTVLITDSTTASSGYALSLLTDQSTSAPSGQSSFRFINEATKAGAVDIYMVPSTSTLAKSSALVTDLAVGATPSYTSFTAQTVTLVIVTTGTNVNPTSTTSSSGTTTTPTVATLYTSSALALTGGEVRTVLLLDSKLTSGAIDVVTLNDMN